MTTRFSALGIATLAVAALLMGTPASGSEARERR